MNSPYPGHRRVSGRELAELAILAVATVVLTILATWLAGWIGVAAGWRLAIGAGVAISIVSRARRAYYRARPSWRWWGALVAIWLLILLANLVADVRLW